MNTNTMKTAEMVGKEIRKTIIESGVVNERTVINAILKHDDSSDPQMLEYVPSFVDTFINGPKMDMDDFAIIGYKFSQTYVGLDAESSAHSDVNSLSLLIRNSGIYVEEKNTAMVLAYVTKGILDIKG